MPERIMFVDAEATLATVMDGHTLVADRRGKGGAHAARTGRSGS